MEDEETKQRLGGDPDACADRAGAGAPALKKTLQSHIEKHDSSAGGRGGCCGAGSYFVDARVSNLRQLNGA